MSENDVGNNVGVEAVGEQQCSAWIERGSNGKIKFGCKAYRLDLKDAVGEVFVGFEKMNVYVKDMEV